MAVDRKEYEVVWPRGNSAVADKSSARRLESLENKTVCELWNGSFRGDEIFPIAEEEISNRYAGVRFVSYKELGSTSGAEWAKMLAALPKRLDDLKCDAVISGVGC